jgi:hypothetical protein
MNGKSPFDLEKAKSLLAAGVKVNRDKLKKAANYLRTYLFTGNQEVDHADAQMMEVFDLMQLIHHLLAVTSKTPRKTSAR